MASVIGHAALVFGFSKLIPSKQVASKLLILGILSSMLPDIDVLSYQFGIYGQDPLGHRGLTHSIPFAVLWAFILLIVFHRGDSTSKVFIILYYTVAMSSHGLLDACTNGGDGVAFFYPFSFDRYFLPFDKIQVSPIGLSHLFSDWGIKVIVSELKYILIPSILAYSFGTLLNKYVYK